MNFHFAKTVSSLAKSRRAWLSLGLASVLLAGLTACTAVSTTARPQSEVPTAPSAPATPAASVPAQTAAANSQAAPAARSSEVQPASGAMAGWDFRQFVGKEWRLVTLFGVPANQVPSPRLQWVSTAQVMGSGGCNRFTGRALLTENEARFGPLASTRMACVPEPSSQEDRFFKALEMTARVRMQGAELQLLGSDGAVVAQLAQD